MLFLNDIHKFNIFAMLDDFDLNLLIVFRTLMEERSVTRAGIRLGRTQSAVSNSLRRLRSKLDDPLFIRSRNGLVPTPVSERIAPEIVNILAKTEEVVRARSIFNPASSTHHVSIGAPDRLSLPIMQPLLARIMKAAPSMSVSVRTADREYAIELLEAREIDIGVGWFDDLPGNYRMSEAFTEDLVCLTAKAHPITKKRDNPVSVDEILTYRHVVVTSGGRKRAAFDSLLERIGLRRDAYATLSNFALVPEMLRNSNLVGVFTRRTAQYYATTFDLAVTPLPLDIAPITHKIVWQTRFDNDGMHRWVRNQIAEVCSGAEFAKQGR